MLVFHTFFKPIAYLDIVFSASWGELLIIIEYFSTGHVTARQVENMVSKSLCLIMADIVTNKYGEKDSQVLKGSCSAFAGSLFGRLLGACSLVSSIDEDS